MSDVTDIFSLTVDSTKKISNKGDWGNVTQSCGWEVTGGGGYITTSLIACQ
jgi:hypothetical protein